MLPGFNVYPILTPVASPTTTPASQENLFQKVQAYQDLQKRRKEAPADVLLDYTFLDKGLHKLKTLFITLPKTIWRGLKGSEDYTFSDAMLVAKVPYYLGGAFLALSPFLGGNKREGIRQEAAVLLYLLGATGTNLLINTLYRLRYGVDLTMMYRSKTGQVENVYGSSDFPRFDLLKPRHYNLMAKKMGTPDDVYEKDGAIRENLRHIINTSRTLKLIMANLLSAIGAGYLARSDAWLEVPKVAPVIRQIWQNPSVGTVEKAQKTVRSVAATLRGPLVERLSLSQKGPWQKAIIFGSLGALFGTICYIWFKAIPEKQYSTGVLSPREEFFQEHQNDNLQQIPALPVHHAGTGGMMTW